ncbi:cytochrome D1 domain-containing protein [Actinophytocola sp.]|uniref:cytochrome D1 domain-containing protein n=1 Tax=Actinophytocola sp. TaxID=1872138 RepID=UPI00389B3951
MVAVVPAAATTPGFGVVDTVDVAVEPFGATTAPDGRTVWVANSGPLDDHIGRVGHTVTVLGTRTHAIQSVIDVGIFPEDIAFAFGGRQAFVTDSTDATISVIDATTRTVTQTIDLAPIPVTFPFGVVATRDSRKVYVTTVGGASDAGIVVLDNRDPHHVRVAGTITLPGFTGRPALTPDGRLLVVPRGRSDGGPEAVLIDTATDRVVADIGLTDAGGPQAATITPDGRFAYVGIFGGVLGGDGGVAVVDLTRRTTIRVIATPAPEVHGVRVSPDGRFVIATNFHSASISLISTRSNRVVATVPVGNRPNDVAFSPGGRRAFVTNQGDTTVSVVSVPRS